MRFILLSIFFISLYPKEQNYFNPYKTKRKIPIHYSSENLKPQYSALFTAMISGNKKILNANIKNLFKNHGLMHLLTPSGLHLSSILLLIPRGFASIIICIFILILIRQYEGYDSLERVIYFKFIYSILNSLKFNFCKTTIVFLITLSTSLILGHWSNPLSFLYSTLFWGIILSYHKDSTKLHLYLFLALLITNLTSNESTLLTSIFINPSFTIILSTLFPLIFFNTFLDINFLNSIFTQILDIIFLILSYSDTYSPKINISLFQIYILVFIINKKLIKFAIPLLILSPTHLNSIKNSTNSLNKDRIIWNLDSNDELLNTKKNKIRFFESECVQNGLRISCKKKPSKFGGPNI